MLAIAVALNSRNGNRTTDEGNRHMAGDFWRVKQKKLVYYLGSERCAVQRGTGFEQNAENLPPAEFLQNGFQIYTAPSSRRADNFDSHILQLARLWRFQRGRRENQQIIVERFD